MNQTITEFGRFPVTIPPENFQPRPDRQAIACVLPYESKMQVGELSATGWRNDSPHTEIFPASLTYGSTGRMAYIVREDGKQFVVLDGEVQAEGWEAVSDELGWSSAGQSYGFVGKRGEEIFVATPDETWKIEGRPLPARFAQNCDGSQIAWIVQAKQQQLFINGQLYWEAPELIENPVWSPDGKRMAFAFANQKGAMIRVDGREFGPYPNLAKGGPVWSPDSRRCGWITQRKGKSVLIVDGEERSLPVSVVQGGTLAFSPDGNRWALAARAGFMNFKGCIVEDGKSGPVFMGLGTTPPVWSPAGDALAYFALSGLKTAFIVCDGREGQRCSAFIDGSLTWNHDGSVVGCIAQQDNQACLLLEERDGHSWSLRPETGALLRGNKIAFDENKSLHDLGFRPDGSVFGWTAHF